VNTSKKKQVPFETIVENESPAKLEKKGGGPANPFNFAPMKKPLEKQPSMSNLKINIDLGKSGKKHED